MLSVPFFIQECHVNESGTASQTDITSSCIASLQSELQQRNEEVYQLREKLKKVSLDQFSFEDDSKMLFYTGLPNVRVFNLILSYIEPALHNIRVQDVSNFQKLLMCLMKLRLNMSFKGLGYRFGIQQNRVAIIIKKVIIVLEYTFRCLIHWPDRESMRTLTPKCFLRNFSEKVAVIIDCFEIRIQKPSTLKAKIETFSHYKNTNTAKYLMAITAHGHISFLSDGYGGRISDKSITEQCGVLDHLLPGDVVLADRGFNIYELVAEQQAQLNIPSFTRGRKQLHPREVESTRKIANVRIHVERVIGLVRNKFKILEGPIPIWLLRSKYRKKNLLDYIVRVCCMLCNITESIVEH